MSSLPGEMALEPVRTGLGAAVPLIALMEVLEPSGRAPGWAPYLLGAAAVAMAASLFLSLGARSLAALAAGLGLGQLGWLLGALSGHNRLSAAAAVFLLGAYAVVLAGLPIAAGSAWRSPMAAVSGLGGRAPARAAAIALGLLSLAGLPPLAGWFGEFAVSAELARGGHMWLLGLGLLQFVVAVAVSVRAVAPLYLAAPRDAAPRLGAHALSKGSAAALVVFLAAYGVFANPLHSLAVQGAAALGLR